MHIHSFNIITRAIGYFSLVTILLFSFNALADNQVNKHEHHNLMGSHGMVLMHHKDHGFFVSHLPLYVSPHHYQLIYKVKIAGADELIHRLQKKMVTVVPENFDLSRLINNERFSIDTKFYQGHFERGGKHIFSAKMTFEKSILIEKISPTFTNKTAIFQTVAISKHTAIFAHKIQQSPSFDAVGFIKNKAIKSQVSNNKNKKIKTPNSIMHTDKIVCQKPSTLDARTIKQQLKRCAQFDIKYIETKDFS